MPKKVTMADIAQNLGVSKNTVSLALRNMPVISKKTRDLVYETAKKMGYVYEKKTNPFDDVKNASGSFCLFLPGSIQNVEFFSYIQFGIEKEARKNRINIILYYVDDSFFNEMPLSIQEGMVDGIIMLGQFPYHTVKSIMSFHLPTVVVDMYYDNLELDYILTDNISGGYRITEYLISKGHRRIGFCGDINKASSFYDRYQGYLKAMNTNGLCVEKKWNRIDNQTELRELFSCSLQELPTAFFCTNDACAAVLIKALEEVYGKQASHISIAGFDNIPQAGFFTTPFVTMHVEKELMGEKAVQRLIHMIRNKGEIPIKTMIPATLVERKR